MKLELTSQRLAANRTNSSKGGQVVQARAMTNYNLSPKQCQHCLAVLPYEKRLLKFCNHSCSAKHSNTGRVRVHPYQCLNCDSMIKSGKYCSTTCSGKARTFRTTEDHRARRNETSANYRAKLRNQTPANVDRRTIREFYSQCPQGYEVDHIVPISKGGLHVLANLQYLTITENRRKSNKII